MNVSLKYFLSLACIGIGLSAYSLDYVNEGSWESTILGLRGRNKLETDAGKSSGDASIAKKSSFSSFKTGVMESNTPAVDIDIDITGLSGIELIADAPYGNGSAHSVWGNMVLVYADGREVPLTSIEPTFSSVGWDQLRINKDVNGHKLRVGNRSIDLGFWAHAYSLIRFELDGKAVRLKGFCGVNHSGYGGKVQFEVRDTSFDTIISKLSSDYFDNVGIIKGYSANLLKDFMLQNNDKKIVFDALVKLGCMSKTYKSYLKIINNADLDTEKNWVNLATEAMAEVVALDSAIASVKKMNLSALKMAINDLEQTYGDKYDGEKYLAELARYENKYLELVAITEKESGFVHGTVISNNAKTEFSNLEEKWSDNADKLLSENSCDGEWAFHSVENVKNPYVIIDLAKTQEIAKINIVNRPGFLDRAKSLVISVSNDKSQWTDVWKNEGSGKQVWDIQLPADSKARYVKLWLNGDKETFHLKSVKVLAPVATDLNSLLTDEEKKRSASLQEIIKFSSLQREALLANPLLDFEQILAVVRDKKCLPTNWTGNTSLFGAAISVDNEIVAINYKNNNAPISQIYKPDASHFVGEVDLHFDGKKILFSRPKISTSGNPVWHIYELNLVTKEIRQITDDSVTDYDCYDPVYLPNGKIIFNATLGYQGVPCVNGSDYVGNLCIMDADGRNLRRLTYDQDNNWDPVVMNDGKIMYQRWEYTDSAHYFSRILFDMFPDGREQRAMYGSNSYWPNTLFNARPIPNSDTKFVAIVSGHHGIAREGEMIIFDTALGRQEDGGVVQKMPGYGKKVKPEVFDMYMESNGGRWPRFLHPYPLSDKYFLASGQIDKTGNWGIYLVDIFDNMLLLKEMPEKFVYEPLPLKARKTPPVIPDAVNLKTTEATVYISDIYIGPGLEGVKRGTVKELVVYAYEYAFRNTGNHDALGIEGPWDVRKIIGTVPVYEDGSASFKIPANVPVAVLPLDEHGNAMQLFRSWFVGVPGEIVSCVGCHENRDTPPPTRASIAYSKAPSIPKTFKGPFRGFSFDREVQPVLNKYCIGCHNSDADVNPHFANKAKPNFIANRTSAKFYRGWQEGKFLSAPYLELMPYIRRNGPEGTWYVLNPMEFHINTTQLGQMLMKGHHGVKMDKDAWDRLSMWINMNLPMTGRWGEFEPHKVTDDKIARIRELRAKYAGVQTTSEDLPIIEPSKVDFVAPKKVVASTTPELTGWPIANPKELQAKLGEVNQTIDLGNDVTIGLKKIPSGKFIMGNTKGGDDEKQVFVATINKPFWMGETEVSLKQFKQFRKDYKNGFYDRHWKDQVNPGYPLDGNEEYPVIRVSYDEAVDFCKWLSTKIGKKVRLPTEEEWEWACRAGTNTEFSFGALKKEGVDFGKYANLADAKMREMDISGVDPQPRWRVNDQNYKTLPYANNERAGAVTDYEPYDTRYFDGHFLLAPVGSYQANIWGLKNMHGNVAEWTSTAYKPYGAKNVKSRPSQSDLKGNVVRGGSWYDRPYRATSAYRIAYPTWQKVFNVGFRIVIED